MLEKAQVCFQFNGPVFSEYCSGLIVARLHSVNQSNKQIVSVGVDLFGKGVAAIGESGSEISLEKKTRSA